MGYLGTKPANQVVNSDQISDGAVGTSDLANGAVTSTKIANSAVGTSQIADGGVSQTKLGSLVYPKGIPAFYAFANASQSLSATTGTKIAHNSIRFDTANCFNTTTNRFTPNVPGYYWFCAGTRTGNTTSDFVTYLQKNGGNQMIGNICSSDTAIASSIVTGIIPMNGTTDFVDVFVYTGTSVTTQVSPGGEWIYFQGFLVREL